MRQVERMRMIRYGAKYFNPRRVMRLFDEDQITWDQAWDGLALGVKCHLALSNNTRSI